LNFAFSTTQKEALSAYTVPYKYNQNESGGGTKDWGARKKKAKTLKIDRNCFQRPEKILAVLEFDWMTVDVKPELNVRPAKVYGSDELDVLTW
jgi:hypothetical protein